MCLEFTQSQLRGWGVGVGGCVGGDLMGVWQRDVGGGGAGPFCPKASGVSRKRPAAWIFERDGSSEKKTGISCCIFFFFHLFNFFCSVLDVAATRYGPARHVKAFKHLSPSPPLGVSPPTARVEVLGTGSRGDPFFHFNCINNSRK